MGEGKKGRAPRHQPPYPRYDSGLPPKRLLSIIVPVYNEEEFLSAAILPAMNAPLPDGLEPEIVAVNDGSTDSSAEILDELAQQHAGRIRVIHHKQNAGKGAAIRTGLQEAAGEVGIIQDADRE